MLELIGKVFGYLLRNIFISAVMFVIFYSVVTKEFPPDFSKLQSTYYSLQELARLGQVGNVTFQKRNGSDFANSSQENEIQMIDELEKINSQRVKLGAHLMAEGSKVADKSQEKNASIFDQTQILERLRDLEAQLFKLQQRVAELESQKQK